MQIEITAECFDPWQRLLAYPRQPDVAGATVVFVGTMRDSNQGDTVVSMHLEHYPAMAQVYLDETVRRVMHKYRLLDVLLVHRVGAIKPGEAIVLASVWSRHRREARLASHEIIEALKTHAPFWKKEKLRSQRRLTERWVAKNTAG